VAEFTIGPWSLVSARMLSVGTAVYAVACAFYVRRGFALRLHDRWSSLGTTLAMVALAGLLWTVGPQVLPSPFGPALVAVLVASAVVTLAYTALQLQKVLDRVRQALPLPPMRGIVDPEARRKTPHLVMGLILVCYAGLGHLVVRGLALIGVGEPGEARSNLLAARDAPFDVSGHLVGLWWLLFVLYALLPIELIRLRTPDAPFPFKATILSRLRSKEAGLMGAHIHMTAALATAWMLVAPDPARWHTTVPACLALLAVTVFADSASALAGMRWGKAKWIHNRDKSYLGSAAGTLVAFLVTLPLVGAPVAILCALVFLLLDIIAPVPLHVSDNLLNPLGLAVLLVAVRDSVHPLIPGF
jgi:dolichol kinase